MREMKKSYFKILLLGFLFMLMPGKATAGDFSFCLTTSGGNFWAAIPQIPVIFINRMIGDGVGAYTWDWMSVKDSQGKIKVDDGNWFGFKARDLFSDFSYGINFGYQPRFSPLGFFVNGAYKFRQFHMQPDRSLNGYEKYKVNSWTAGATLRITPLMGYYREEGWSPIVELGTRYNKVFSCTAPYNDDAEQFGSGLSYSAAIGIRGTGGSLTLGYEWGNYDYFNRDFKAKDGTMPYADVKSRLRGITLKCQFEF